MWNKVRKKLEIIVALALILATGIACLLGADG